MLKIVRVSGNSLSPDYLEGDFVIASKIPYLFSSPKHNDIVVFQLPSHGTLIKRVDGHRTNEEGIFVVGTHPDSWDSRHFGPISPHSIVGKVIWHIKARR